MPPDIVAVDVVDAIRSTATDDIPIRHFAPMLEPPPGARQRFVELALGRVAVVTYINDRGQTSQAVQSSVIGGASGCGPPERAACPQDMFGVMDGTTTFLGIIRYPASTAEIDVDGQIVPVQVDHADGFTFVTATTNLALDHGFQLLVNGTAVCPGSG